MNTDEASKILMNSIPGLRDVHRAKSLGDYYAEKTRGLASFQSFEKDLMIDIIAAEADRLFGAGAEVREELVRHPVAETGTHLGFIRDNDTGHAYKVCKIGDEFSSSRMNQNILVSALLAKNSGAKTHVGLYCSNVFLSEDMSGGGFQIGEFTLPVNKPSELKSATLFASEKIKEDYFNTSVLLALKLKQLRKLAPQNLQDKLSMLLKPLETVSTNYKTVQGNYDSINADKRVAIEKGFEQYNLDYLDKEYQHLKNIFADPRAKNMADQVALAEADYINRVLEGTGIRHINVDSVAVTTEFFVRALETKGSFWHEVFSDKDCFEFFHRHLSGIRSGWAADESPFLISRTKNGMGALRKMPTLAIEHTPENLAPLLREGKIAPGTCLQILAAQSAGVLNHGWCFQSNYATEVKNRFEDYLCIVGKENLCHMVRR